MLLMAEMSKLAYYKFEIDTDGDVMSQNDLDDVLGRHLALGGEVVGDVSADSEEVDQLSVLPQGVVRLKDDLARAGF